MKKCPFCAEEIQSEAIKCRYCGSQLKTQENLSGQPTSNENKVIKILWVGCAILFGGLYLLGNVFNVSENLTSGWVLIIAAVIAFLCWRYIFKEL